MKTQCMTEMLAQREIEYLRRRYARATDLLGLNTEEGIAQGRDIYHTIFTADARISATADGEVLLSAIGPDGWVDVAAAALAEFAATQHLIGTQLVDIQSLPDGRGEGGRAMMISYLQAWHDTPGRLLDIFIGTYHDVVEFVPGIGWQIAVMELERVSGKVHTHTDAGSLFQRLVASSRIRSAAR